MSIGDFLFGRPLASSEEQSERIGAAAGIPIFGLDALSSAAYGPEAALTILIPLGLAGTRLVVPTSVCIIVLLAIVYLSYRQTIEAYPTGGGSYTVARQNLGVRFGLLAASALLIDYVLTAAVGISAGVGALVSAIPSLQPHTLALCLGILAALTIVNLRGVREAGAVFMAPTYLFIACLLGAIGVGVAKTILSGGHPHPVVALPKLKTAATAASAWLLVKAFASGCTAMTGVEAVSNGVQAFREPVVVNARRTLTVIIGILIVMLAGVAYLVRAYGIGATEPGQPGYESVLSQLVAAVAGKDAFYFVTIGSILLVLALSANTAFADFPRLCRAIALDGFLPFGFAVRGRRLVYSHGIGVLAALTAALLIIFGGVTDRLIPLFAIGAFLAFTLSQAGMVAHWKKAGGAGAGRSMFINGLGATATLGTTLVVAIAKFAEGAWITLLLIPALLVLMTAVQRHYRSVEKQIASPAPLEMHDYGPPLVVVTMDAWNRVSKKALRFALSISPDVHAVHVEAGETTEDLRAKWRSDVEEPARRAGAHPPALVVLESPFRHVVQPILDYVLELEHKNPKRIVSVVICELVERRWYHYLLHNQRGEVMTALLLIKGDRRIVVVNIPWYLEDREPARRYRSTNRTQHSDQRPS